MKQNAFHMSSWTRQLGSVISAGIAVLAWLVASEASARNLRGIDALRDAAPVGKSLEQNQSAKKADAPAQTHYDSRLGVPTFLWGQTDGRTVGIATTATTATTAAAAVVSDPVAIARAYLAGFGAQYRLTAADAALVPLLLTQKMPNGATLVKFRNRINDIEVFREDAAVMLSADNRLVAIGGYVMSGDGSVPFKLSGASAAEVALSDWSFAAGTASALTAVVNRDGYQHYELPVGTVSGDGSQLAIPVRVKPVLFRLPTRLVPSYYVEVQVRDGLIPFGLDSYAYVVSAEDSSVLFRNNQTADVAFSYKVFAEPGPSFLPLPSPTGRNGFPHPTGVADGYQGPFVAPNLNTLQNFPFSRNDPWLPSGATTTTGNNVDAFADIVSPDDFQAGDLRATTTSANTFDRTYNTAAAPNVSNDQIMASVANLFYMNNFLHDWYYDSGFDEAAGNAQSNNFGRGGAASDPIYAEAQDFASVNNANMSTPADGARPRMRMYVFNGLGAQITTVNSPAAIAGNKLSASAGFGAQTFDLTRDVVATMPADGGCTAPLTNAAALVGKIALIDRGTCGFTVKVKNAQTAGAVGVIMVTNVAGAPTGMGGTDATVTIPALQISQSEGAAIKAQLALPTTVNARLRRTIGVNRDGTLDNGVIAHEWGHYISNRLIGNANGLTTNHANGMGEGWADFHAMLLLVKESDPSAPNVPNNANFAGTYAIGGYLSGGPDFAPDALNNGFYAGIRRYPYSRDMTKNPLSFRHITNGVALPASPAPAFGADGASNSEVHNTGEVWATMLWECYSNLLNDTPRLTFAQAQDRMKAYLVAGYKLTPSAPTMVEARDALLAAMLASDQTDYARCYAGFAKRGAGVGAVAPDRYSLTNAGVVESTVVGGAMSVVSVTITDSPAFCDGDEILDNGETGTMTVTLRNVGTATLSSTTVSVSSTNAHLSFPSGAALTIPTTVPQQTVAVTLPVRVTGASGVETADIAVSVDDPQLATVRPVVGHVLFRINADQKPNQLATDDVESTHTTWITGSSISSPTADLLWQRATITGIDHRWVGPDSGTSQLTWLQSPPLTVAATGNFSFTFRHRFSYEFDTSGNYDGGQIQISANNGPWTDIGASASPPYNGTLLGYAGNTNPLQGLSAYVKQNAAYPSLETVTVGLGTTYAGQTVRVRFAIGSDAGGGGGGWDVDDIAFTNITNTPFDAIVAHAGACYSLTPQAGTPQSTAINTAFGTALKVLVKDGGGTPVSGAAVTFTVPTTGATAAFATASAVTTNVSGVATATTLTANAVVGAYLATATVGIQSAVFMLRNKLACSLDLDDDGVVLAHTDALLLARYIANALPSVDLTANAKNPSSLVTASSIQAAVEAMKSGLFVDVDGDNVVDSKDALIVLRALLGFRDTGLTNGLSLGSSTRQTGALMRSWLVTNCGLTLP